MSKEKIFYVIEEHNGIPEGSGICVIRETKTEYVGYWSSMAGTYKVKVDKDKCEK